MDVNAQALLLHEKHQGKIEVISKVPVQTRDDLSLAYTPGVAEPCRRIHENKEDVYKYTARGNLVAIVSDGTAVLGLGDIGPEAALPVMEGKAILFKTFANVDAFPICLDTKDPAEIVKTVKYLSPTFGGINLEDIAAPNCFQIEEQLKKELDIPVFHDDQHGTAIVVLAGIINALKLVGKNLGDIKVVINGAGAAAIAVLKLLLTNGVKEAILCDSKGIVYEGRAEGMNPYKEEMAKVTNRSKLKGSIEDALKDADVFIGLSKPKTVTQAMVKSMGQDPVIFAMANPTPEIMPDEARAAGAAIIATGRSDFPNQINNVLAFPGVFKGTFEVRASEINEAMKNAAAFAIAGLIDAKELNKDYIIPNPFDRRVVDEVAKAVARAARETGVARI